MKISRFILLICLTLNCLGLRAQSVPPSDVILGKWMSADKDLEVEVYKVGNEFKAKMIWFKADDNSKTMEEWTDKHNPDVNLRTRKLLGMVVVKDLVYDAKSNSWGHGTIYDAKSGRYWDASATLARDGKLKVTGYWHFKFIGRVLTFVKADG